MASDTTSATPDDLRPPSGSVTMLSTGWCGFCARLRSQLTRDQLPFTEIDIDAHPEHVGFVEQVNHGNRTVPTIVFPDGSTATNPSLAEVRARLEG